jgi:membrane-bound lytic murein transglycosylase D
MVPPGRGPELKSCLATLPAEKRVAFRTHVVGRGQTLASLARRYGTKAADVAAANGIPPGKRLARGTELIIPVKPGAALDLAAGTRIQHRVRAGESLIAIAQRYKTTVEDLMSWNNLRGTRLAAGNLLTIYTIR